MRKIIIRLILVVLLGSNVFCLRAVWLMNLHPNPRPLTLGDKELFGEKPTEIIWYETAKGTVEVWIDDENGVMKLGDAVQPIKKNRPKVGEPPTEELIAARVYMVSE